MKHRVIVSALAGLGSGLVILGIGGRLFMRLLAFPDAGEPSVHVDRDDPDRRCRLCAGPGHRSIDSDREDVSWEIPARRTGVSE